MIRKQAWCVAKLKELKQAESEGEDRKPIVKMTLERIRKKSLDEQKMIRENNESCERWPNGEKAFKFRVDDDNDKDHDNDNNKNDIF